MLINTSINVVNPILAQYTIREAGLNMKKLCKLYISWGWYEFGEAGINPNLY